MDVLENANVETRQRRDDCILTSLKRSMRRLGKSVVDGERWVDTNGDGDADADEVIVFRLLVNNIGTVTLRSIVLSDGAVDRDRISCDPSLPDSLAPEEGFKCHATYTVR